MPGKEQVSAPVRLQYKKGDLVMKEGDYGISVYKIIRGRILLFHEHLGKEVEVSDLGEGEVFGEMAFLNRAGQTRRASARAAGDVILEAYHCGELAKEYQRMPPVLKYMADQALRRLVKMNELLTELTEKKQKEKDAGLYVSLEKSRRSYYRKKVNLNCIYRPLESPKSVRLKGIIRDLSLTGIAVEINSKNISVLSHDPGRRFRFETVLPNGKNVNFITRVMSRRNSDTPGTFLVGMSFVDMPEETKKSLGFFMMPT